MNKRRIFIIIFFILVISLSFNVFANTETDKSIANKSELIENVNFVEGLMKLSQSNLDSSLNFVSKKLIVKTDNLDFETYGGNLENIIDNIFLITYETEKECEDAYNKIKNDSKIISIEIDQVLETEENDDSINSDENSLEINKTELSKYLDSINPSKSVKVAILDTGLDDISNILSNKIIDLGINLSDSGDSNSIFDDNGHGTKIAKLICTNSNDNVEIMPIKVANSEGKSSIINVYLGIKRAVENGANVINISMNTYKTANSEILEEAINEATEQGVIVVVSSGNNGINTNFSTPSNVESAIVVGAVTQNNVRSKYSNYGNTVVYSAYGLYMGDSGTSFAAARVSGIIANILSKNEDIKILDEYATDLGNEGKDSYYGKGFIGLEYNKMDSDVIPEDNYESSIFDVDWKKLTQEQLSEYIENADTAELAIFLQSLSKEDLDYILSMDTIFYQWIQF